MKHNQEAITSTKRISKPKAHSGQTIVLNKLKRFNVLANGRRWGKTKFAIKLAMETMIKGQSVGYFVPTFEFAEDFWEEIKDRLESITIYKSESKRIIRLITGGELKIWSLEKKRAGRGRKYHRVIIDEAAFVKDLKYSWEKVIRATLADYKGDAFFLSSPIFGSYFHELFLNTSKKGFENWAKFQMASSTNPYISKKELAEIKSQLDILTYKQEFEAEFVNLLGSAFAHCFKRERHVKDCGELKKHIPVRLSFDFNVNPMTCIISQHHPEHKWIYTRHEIRLPNSNIFDMCRRVKMIFGNEWDDYTFTVTGDPAGKSRSGMVEGENMNYYKIIKAQLDLSDEAFDVAKSHMLIKNSIVICNSLLYRHPKLFIHPDCKHLINDMELVQILDGYKIDKSNLSLTHLLDCWRYYIETYFKSFVKLR